MLSCGQTDAVWLSNTHMPFSFHFLSMTEESIRRKKLVNQDKDREIIHQLVSEAKQPCIGQD